MNFNFHKMFTFRLPKPTPLHYQFYTAALTDTNKLNWYLLDFIHVPESLVENYFIFANPNNNGIIVIMLHVDYINIFFIYIDITPWRVQYNEFIWLYCASIPWKKLFIFDYDGFMLNYLPLFFSKYMKISQLKEI